MMHKQKFHYLSADQRTSIHAISWQRNEQPIAIIQIAHGMVEHIDRYDEFAIELAKQGFLVVGNDHLGHGSSISDKSQFGYFASSAGDECVLADMHQLTILMKKKYPKIPYFILGHSMGSFFTRRFICQYNEDLAGVIICGTAWQSKFILSFAKSLTHGLAKLKGWNYRSTLINNLALGGMNKAFEPARTPSDWLSRDTTIVDNYLSDKKNQFIFTLNGYYNLFNTIQFIEKNKNINNMPKELPIFFIAGTNDPVGNYGKGVIKTAETFKKNGLKNVKVTLYPECRHEILNELNRENIYGDIINWLNKQL